MSNPLPVGCFVRLEKPALQQLIDRLKEEGYRVIGPTVSQQAVVYEEINSLGDMPQGYVDDQEAGQYRLKKSASQNYFDYVVGPHSLKNFLFTPRTTLLETINIKGDWQMRTPPPTKDRLAFLGLRSCDLHALQIQDRVFLGGPYPDCHYEARREELFVLAVNCGRSAATCFCKSMGTGPAVNLPADLLLTEMADYFVLAIGSEQGGEVLADLPWQPCSTAEVTQAREVPKQAEKTQRRRLDTAVVHDLLLDNLEHPRWDQVAQRCLSCTNCTMVCPTCFCSQVQEVSDLTGDQVRRERLWDSCFTDDHSYMNSGQVHKSTAARYRQWLTHKLATWIDQFGTSGCVGCGRCITWCPVGIDLTEEVAAIQEDTK